MEKGNCRLCGKFAELQESHIIPKFIYKWLKTSGGGHLRSGQNPNIRIQDGHKYHWLCEDCEQRFNKWETLFSKNIFHRMNQDNPVQIKYASWFLPFCVSISWRVLNFHEEFEFGSKFPEKYRKRVDHAKTIWKEFLLGQKPHPENYEQHFLPLDAVTHATFDMPTNINRYIFSAIDTEIFYSDEEVFIFSKLGKLAVLGFIGKPNPKLWKGTKVHLNKGYIKPMKRTFSRQFSNFFMKRAGVIADQYSKISSNQKQKITETMSKDPHATNSESFKGMSHDVRLFGEDAFNK